MPPRRRRRRCGKGGTVSLACFFGVNATVNFFQSLKLLTLALATSLFRKNVLVPCSCPGRVFLTHLLSLFLHFVVAKTLCCWSSFSFPVNLENPRFFNTLSFASCRFKLIWQLRRFHRSSRCRLLSIRWQSRNCGIIHLCPTARGKWYNFSFRFCAAKSCALKYMHCLTDGPWRAP